MPHAPTPLTELGDLLWTLADAADTGLRRAGRKLRRRRHGYCTRRPGPDTPMWNTLAVRVRDEIRPYGAKVRLARYLGIPKQRIYDFLNNRSRLPDAELTLRLFHWVAERRAGRDPSL